MVNEGIFNTLLHHGFIAAKHMTLESMKDDLVRI